MIETICIPRAISVEGDNDKKDAQYLFNEK